jgi:hypothetical protein
VSLPSVNQLELSLPFSNCPAQYLASPYHPAIPLESPNRPPQCHASPNPTAFTPVSSTTSPSALLARHVPTYKTSPCAFPPSYTFVEVWHRMTSDAQSAWSKMPRSCSCRKKTTKSGRRWRC